MSGDLKDLKYKLRGHILYVFKRPLLGKGTEESVDLSLSHKDS